VGTMDHGGYSLIIQGGKCVIGSPKSNPIGEIPLICGLYRVDKTSKTTNSATATVSSRIMSINELHHKMGHVNYKDLHKMVKEAMVMGIDLDLESKPSFCKACIKAKTTRKPFPKQSETKYTNYGDKIISDTWGPAPVESLGGKKYYQIYQDLASHEEHIYFNKRKSESFDNYKSMKHGSKLNGMQR
jgi:hypothetical protein